MKICMVVEYYPPHIGGGEVFIQNIAEGLSHDGNECIVITSRLERDLPFLEEKKNLKILRIKVPSFMSRFWFTLLAVPKILLFARRCDLIHGASYGGAFPALFAAKLLRKKCLLTVYEFMGGLWKNLEPNWVKSHLYQISEKIIGRLPFEKFIAISLYTRNCLRLLGIPDHKLEYVYGGGNNEIMSSGKDPLSTRKELGFTSEDFIYLCFGRAGISKGIEYFAAAVPRIIKKVPSAKFIFILTRSGNKIWKRIMSELGKAPGDVVHLLPGMPREQLANYLEIADCVVIPSLSEGFGLAAVEASMLKKRIVATDAGSLPEVVSGEYVLVRPGSPDALAEGCFRAFAGGLDFAQPKDFSWGKTVDLYKKIYLEVLAP